MTTPQPLTGYAIARRNMTAALRAETGRVDPNDGKIMLPWFPAILSPNKRSHWAKKAAAFKKYKADCHIAMLPHRARLKGQTKFRITFRAPDHRRRDADNCVGAIKAAIDALSIVVGVDDSKFEYAGFRVEGMTPGGAVVVEVVE